MSKWKKDNLAAVVDDLVKGKIDEQKARERLAVIIDEYVVEALQDRDHSEESALQRSFRREL